MGAHPDKLTTRLGVVFDRRGTLGLLIEAIATAAVLVLGIARFSVGQQARDTVITARLVTAQSLTLQSAGAPGGAMIGWVGDQTDLIFLNFQSRNSLQIGCALGASPSITIRTNKPGAKVLLPGAKMFLTVIPEGSPAISFDRPDGRNALSAGLFPDGMPFLSLHGGPGEGGVRFSKRQEDVASVALLDRNGDSRIISSYDSNFTNLSMFGAERHVRTACGLLAGSGPKLCFYDESARAIVEMISDTSGRSMMRLNDTEARESRTLK